MNPPSGVELELAVYNALTKILSHGMLGLDPDCTRVFHRKRYWSDARKSYIEADVSLELTLPNADVPSLIWIWECKDYSGKVGVDDIEEFDSKLQQIGANNTKGTVITTHGFERSAVEYAKSRRIGLAHMVKGRHVVTELYSHPPKPKPVPLSPWIMDPTGLVDVDGLDLDGSKADGWNPPSYISRQLSLLLPRKAENNCSCCGGPQIATAMDIRCATFPRQESEKFVHNSILVWKSFLLCDKCALLIKRLPGRTGLFRSAIGCGFATACFIALALGAGVAAVTRSWAPMGLALVGSAILLASYRAYVFTMSRLVLGRMRKHLGIAGGRIDRYTICGRLLDQLSMDLPPKRDYVFGYGGMELPSRTGVLQELSTEREP